MESQTEFRLERGICFASIPGRLVNESACQRRWLWQFTVALNIMDKPKITAYLKPSCGWSQGVRAIMRKYDLPFEDRDIINDPVQRQEMIEKSGQMLSPCVEVNGHMLADVSGEEVEAYLLAHNLTTPAVREADAPTNQPCAHEAPQGAPMFFRR
jgi:glutaredoxin